MSLDVLTIGGATSNSCNIVVGMSGSSTVTVQYSTDPNVASPQSALLTVGSGTDFAGVIPLLNLLPDTQYYFKVLDGATVIHTSAPYPTFKTFPTNLSPVAFRFAIVGDYTNEGTSASPGGIADTGMGALVSVVTPSPRFALHLGDHIYGDQGAVNLSVSNSTANWNTKYKNMLSVTGGSNYAVARTLFPWFSAWDDHDLAVNDFNGGTGSATYNNAKAYFLRYPGAGNPVSFAGNIYYNFNYGNVGFFVMDTRSFRSPEANADDTNKHMLGLTQEAALQTWLIANNDKYVLKFIISSVSIHLYGKLLDSWKGYQTARNRLFDFIKDNRIQGVIFLSADEHFAVSARSIRNAVGYVEYQVGAIRQDPKTSPTINSEISLSIGDVRSFGLIDVDTTITPFSANFTILSTANTLLGMDMKSSNDCNSGIPGVRLLALPRGIASPRNP
jgi:alkaline phosphatase D